MGRKLSRSANVLPSTTEEDIPSIPLQSPKIEALQYHDQHVQLLLKQLGSSKSFADVLEFGFLVTGIDESALLSSENNGKRDRFKTLKFTLTPLDAREPEAIIYSGMNMVLEDLSTGTGNNHEHEDNYKSNSEFSIPVGGFGAESVSAKKLIIRKVFKKLNGGVSSGSNAGMLSGNGPSGSGVMITSSDFEDKK